MKAQRIKRSEKKSANFKADHELKVFRKFSSYYPDFVNCKITPVDNDPPDVICIDSQGKRIGFELTELIDEAYLSLSKYWQNLVASSVKLPDWDIMLRIQDHSFPNTTDKKKIRAELETIVRELIANEPQRTYFNLESDGIKLAPTLSIYCDDVYGYYPGNGNVSAVPGLLGLPRTYETTIKDYWRKLVSAQELDGWDSQFIIVDTDISEVESDVKAIHEEIIMALQIGTDKAGKQKAPQDISFVVNKDEIEKLGASVLSKYCLGIYAKKSPCTSVTIVLPPTGTTPELATIRALKKIIRKKVDKKNYHECITIHQLEKLHLLVYLDHNILKSPLFAGEAMLPVIRLALEQSATSVPFDACFLYSVNYFVRDNGGTFVTSLENALSVNLSDHNARPYFCVQAWPQQPTH